MKKVMVFGVFDLLHPGHISFLKQAKTWGDYLVVSIARDKNVRKFKNKLPFRSEKERMALVRTLRIADKVILGGVGNPWPHIKQVNPDVIALGYDQKFYVTDGNQKNFEQELLRHGIRARVVRLKPFKPEIFKTSKIRKTGNHNL